MSTFQQLDDTTASRLLSQSDASDKSHHKDSWIDWEQLETAFKYDDFLIANRLYMLGEIYTFERLENFAFVQRLNDLVPCGWFSISQVRRKVEAMHSE